MADSTQANWNAVKVIYGSGDATIPMKDQERTCLFHWAQSLEKHTKANIRVDIQHPWLSRGRFRTDGRSDNGRGGVRDLDAL
jgi:hypothetical protein